MAVVVVVVVFPTLTRIMKSVVTGQAPAGEYPREKHKQTKRGISQLTQFMPPPETYKTESEVSLRCLSSIKVHTSHFSRLEKTALPVATRARLLRIYIHIARSSYILRILTDASPLETRRKTEKTKKERKEKRKNNKRQNGIGRIERKQEKISY